MARFISLLISGVSLGFVMALVALGFLVLYKATGIVNFAHGDLVTLGAYFALWGTTSLGMPTIAAYAFALVLMFAVGITLERVAYAPLRKRPVLIVVIATLAASLVIEAALSLWWGSTPQALPSPVGNGVVMAFGAPIPDQEILIIIVCLVIISALFYVFHRTSIGRQVRALASDREMAEMVGIRSRRISVFVFAVSATLAGVAGLLIAPLSAVSITFGFSAMITAFVAAVIGGFGSFLGVVIGGLFIGLLQQVVGGYLVPNYADTLPFVVLFIVIAIRPEGLSRTLGGARL